MSSVWDQARRIHDLTKDMDALTLALRTGAAEPAPVMMHTLIKVTIDLLTAVNDRYEWPLPERSDRE